MTKKKEVTKKVEKVEVKQPEKKPANLTQGEAAIFERVKVEGQDREWERVTEGDAHDFTLAQDPMKLPEFAEKLLNQMDLTPGQLKYYKKLAGKKPRTVSVEG